MGERRQAAQHGGIADQDIEPAEPFGDRPGHLVDPVVVGEVDGHQSRLGAPGRRGNPVVDLFQRAGGPGGEDRTGAFRRETLCHRGADAARRAGDQRDPAVQGAHGFRRPLPAARARCRSIRPRSR